MANQQQLPPETRLAIREVRVDAIARQSGRLTLLMSDQGQWACDGKSWTKISQVGESFTAAELNAFAQDWADQRKQLIFDDGSRVQLPVVESPASPAVAPSAEDTAPKG